MMKKYNYIHLHCRIDEFREVVNAGNEGYRVISAINNREEDRTRYVMERVDESDNLLNKQHLEWIYNRLQNEYNVNKNVDYMIEFRIIINSYGN